MLRNCNRLLASMTGDEYALLARHLREVPISQGQLLEERGQRSTRSIFRNRGWFSLIVEMPEDETVEVGMIGSEGAIGLNGGLGSRIASITSLVQVSGVAFKVSASRFRGLVSQSAAPAKFDRASQRNARRSDPAYGGVQRPARCRSRGSPAGSCKPATAPAATDSVYPRISRQDAGSPARHRFGGSRKIRSRRSDENPARQHHAARPRAAHQTDLLLLRLPAAARRPAGPENVTAGSVHSVTR